MTNEETFNGAKNRVMNMENNDGDFYVGIEGGCLKFKKKTLCLCLGDSKKQKENRLRKDISFSTS